jgi:hypothetical protein
MCFLCQPKLWREQQLDVSTHEIQAPQPLSVSRLGPDRSSAVAQSASNMIFNDSVCSTFSWHTSQPQKLELARSALAQAKVARQSSFDFSSLKWLSDGFCIARKTPSTYNAGWQYFSRLLGACNSGTGNNVDWCVIGYAKAYDRVADFAKLYRKVGRPAPCK